MRPLVFIPIYVSILCAGLSMAQAQSSVEAIKGLYGQAVDAYNAKDFDRSMNLYQQLIKAAPNFAPAYNGMALAEEGNGDVDKAIGYLKTSISYDPKLTQAYENLGKIYYDRQDFDHAQTYFEKALDVDPSSLTSKLSLAWIYLLVRSNPEKALAYFQDVLAAAPSPNIYFGMGWAYFADNQRSKAMDMITKLNMMGQDDLANRLEESMRQHRWVDAQPNAPAPEKQPAQFTGQIAPTPQKPSGIQARLRGKLSDY